MGKKIATVVKIHQQKANESIASMSKSLIDINTADARLLETIKGIGPGKAREITAYRKEHGKFASIEDLAKVKGIGPKLIAKIKSSLTV